jgi:hypothetical protein
LARKLRRDNSRGDSREEMREDVYKEEGETGERWC